MTTDADAVESTAEREAAAKPDGEAASEDGEDDGAGASVDVDPAVIERDAVSVEPADGEEPAGVRLRDRLVWVVPGLLVLALTAAAIAGAEGVPAVPNNPGPIIVLALATGTLAFALFVRRVFGDTDRATTTDVEYRRSVAVPGTDFDTMLHRATHGVGGQRYKAIRRVHDRLTGAAVSVYAHARRIPEEEAETAIEAGTWTDDDTGAFLSEEGAGISPTVDQLRTLIGLDSKLRLHADRIVAALAEMTSGIDSDDPVDGGSGSETGRSDGAEAGDEDDGSETAAEPTVTDTRGHRRREADRRTGRWRGVGALTLIALAGGLYAAWSDTTPSLVVAAAALVGAAGYVSLARPPEVSLIVERDLSTADPAPGETVTVTVTVTNAADSMVPDFRLTDGVPPGLVVSGGSPRYATALRGGESVTYSYAIEASRGHHVFEPMQVLARDFSGAVERERHVETGEPTVLSCGLQLVADEDVPVHPHTARRVGRVTTDTGGSGVELHSVREYRRGDPLSRVDWNRVASTGEFATLQFREEHAATVVLLVDARKQAYVAPRVDGPSAVEYEIAAADVVLSSLVSAGDSVGLAALSPELCWLEPRGGRGQAARARRLLETHSAFGARRPEKTFHGGIGERWLRRELPSDAQLVMFSPLCDDDAVMIARSLHARDYPVTIVSPDVTRRETTGQRLAAVERGIRISLLRRVGVRVVDWDADTPLETALDAADRRWRR